MFRHRRLMGPTTVAPDPYYNNVVALWDFQSVVEITGQQTLSPAGSTVLNSFGKFEAGSLSIGSADISNDLIAGAAKLRTGSSNFTVETWLYKTSAVSSSTQAIYSIRSSSSVQFLIALSSTGIIFSCNGTTYINYTGGHIELNEWHHIALTRSGNVVYLFLNGQLVGSSAFSVSTVGSAGVIRLAGDGGWTPSMTDYYMDSFRVTRGTARYTESFARPTGSFPTRGVDNADQYWASVIGLLNFDGNTNDGSSFNHTVTNTGVTFDSTTAVYGSAGAFNGTSYVTLPNTSTCQIRTNNFTIEMWIRQASKTANRSGHQSLFYQRSSAGGLWFVLQSNGSMEVVRNDTVLHNCPADTITLDNWYHVAIVRDRTAVRGYTNGVQWTASTTNALPANTDFNIAQGMRIGGHTYNFDAEFNGFVDGVRITTAARYLSNFTPPELPF